MDMSTPKRTPNFSYQEKKKLLMLIEYEYEKYAEILENKNTNKVTIKEKDETWNAIEAEFNSSGTIIYYRNKDSLRRLYENNKKDLRKKMANEKANIIKTGGGSSYIPIYDELEEILIRILNEKTLVGLKSKWDCDADDSPIPVKRNKENSNYEVYLEGSDESTYNNESDVLDKQPEICKSKANILKGASKRNNYKIIGTACEKPKGTKRRPFITRALTSSHVAEKYNILLDKRLDLISKQLEHEGQLFELKKREQELKIKLLELQLNTFRPAI